MVNFTNLVSLGIPTQMLEKVSFEAYKLAQDAMANLRSAIHKLLDAASEEGLKNSQIGRALGIYSGHVGHEGHISRTVLALMEAEGVVEQDPETKNWRLRKQVAAD